MCFSKTVVFSVNWKIAKALTNVVFLPLALTRLWMNLALVQSFYIFWFCYCLLWELRLLVLMFACNQETPVSWCVPFPIGQCVAVSLAPLYWLDVWSGRASTERVRLAREVFGLNAPRIGLLLWLRKRKNKAQFNPWLKNPNLVVTNKAQILTWW